MAEPQDKLLSNAGGLLMLAGGLATLTGGLYGLARQEPGIVVLSILLLIGYGVVGYLLMSRGARHFNVALPGAAVLVLATLFLFRRTPTSDFGGRFFLDPALTLVLAFAGGALLTHALEEALDRVEWPTRPPRNVGTLLFVAAYAPVWNAFVLLEWMVRPSAWATVLVVGASAAAAIACVVGGHAANRRRHPAVTLAGASAGFLACVLYLFQFMLGGGNRDLAFFGQLNALLGLVLSGLPIAIAAVAWIQLGDEEPVADRPHEG
ncbi:MAG TPA: hypothetical protein VNX21_03690 [Candidatus Thermoplasmatota archaeon]|nr:hypothetical protein [Candidatus Thermoplasmatota archaeon]